MALARRWPLLATFVVLASCATAPAQRASQAPQLQDLLVRSEPPGASCEVLQRGSRVASVLSCPASVSVPVPRAPDDLEIVCRKAGYVDASVSYPAIPLDEWQREAAVENPPAETNVLGEAAKGMLFFAVILPLVVFPPAGLAANLVALPLTAAHSPVSAYAYESAPVIVLVPSIFESESAREAFFESRRAVIEVSLAERRAVADKACGLAVCEPGASSCERPASCAKRFAQIDAQRKSALEALPALRAQTRTVAP